MVSQLERNFWFSTIGLIYTYGCYKLYLNRNTVSLESYKTLKQRTENFFEVKNKLDSKFSNINTLFFPKHKKIFIIVGVEDNVDSLKESYSIIKDVILDLTPSQIFFEKARL